MSASHLSAFIVIGAVKGATTWIHAQLQANPAVYLPDPEPHFFSSDYDRGFGFYSDFFAAAEPGQIIGEKSADYLAHPAAPQRIAEVLPSIPLVAQLRDPVERAYSDYKMLYRRGTVRGGPEQYLRPGSEEPRFLEDGLYAKHLERWLDHFDSRQIKVLLYEDVRRMPTESVATVCAHIGAPFHFSEEIGSRRINNSGEKFLPLTVRTALAPFKPSVKAMRGNAAFEKVRGLFAKEISYPPLTSDLRARLTDFYADDVARLGRLIGRDLTAWQTPRRAAA